jgi:uncharacterized protein (TIGR02145 family)
MKFKSLLSIVFYICVVNNLHGQILPAAFGVSTPSKPIITSGLVLYLDAGNTSYYPGSGTTWTDLSSSGNNGTLTNGPTYSSSNGGSIVFDGGNDFISFSTGLPSTDNLTYEAWVNPSVLNGLRVILMPDNWIASSTAIEFDGNLLQFALYGESDKYSTYTFNTNNWYQIAVVYSKSAKTISFYVNGSLTNTENYNNPSTVSNTTLKMGAWDGSSRFFNGNIGQIRIYNRALTAAEILQNYNALRPRFAIAEVTSATGRIWMDRNLGAAQVATNISDVNAYGDLYQWGRGADGHEKITSSTTNVLSNNVRPDHGEFIISTTSNWLSSNNVNLWQGKSGVNNPCPNGFRVPTPAEWTIEINSWGGNTAANAFSSPLKLTLTGGRNGGDGSMGWDGQYGHYWTSTSVGGYPTWEVSFSLSGDPVQVADGEPSSGFSVRCIKD